MLQILRRFKILGCVTLAATASSCGSNVVVSSDSFGHSPDAGAQDGGALESENDQAPTSAAGPTGSVGAPDDGVTKCAGIRQDAPVASGGTDVIFLLDTSGSMLHAITQVSNNMAKFVQDFEAIHNTRVTVITATDPAAGTDVANDRDRYLFIPSIVDSKVLFSTALSLFPRYKDFLRSDAATQFVMITDDNDLTAPSDFRREMEALLGHSFIEHAIASENVNGLPCTSEAQRWNPLCVGPIPAVCAAISIGVAYYDLADLTKGSTQSICKEDWTGVFDQLRAAVIEAVPLPCTYPLASASRPDFDPDKVQVLYTPGSGVDQEIGKVKDGASCGTKGGWYYDREDAPTAVQLCPTSCEAVAAGGSLDVAFGCKPLVVL